MDIHPTEKPNSAAAPGSMGNPITGMSAKVWGGATLASRVLQPATKRAWQLRGASKRVALIILGSGE